ncbi:MAG: CRISPR-associated endonuclease Cas2 [Paludibacteraceae bacterium]|nr:CRISPR-associated endonuclease Cas2 [Paludibacteraceae bacterium]
MLVISYDISDDKLRTNFSKMLTKYGAVRLQFSVYEVNNTDRVLNNLMVMIEEMFAKKFGGGDSVIIFDVSAVKLKKYGNALHRDTDVVYF